MNPTTRVLVGDCRERLKDLPDGSVHCIVTSPPYWGLRSYDEETHETGMIGMEATFEEHLENLLAVFSEAHRVLRSDGTLWLNYGDAYAGGGRGSGSDGSLSRANVGSHTKPSRMSDGIKPKDLLLMSFEVAKALRGAGWWLRAENVWHKPNAMPESATDRPTCAHEKIWLLSKSARYFYDHDAVRTEYREPPVSKHRPASWDNAENYHEQTPGRPAQKFGQQNNIVNSGANLRNVWTVPIRGFSGAHFATFPPRLIVSCILAGTSERGVCSDCGAPWTRIVDVEGRRGVDWNPSKDRLRHGQSRSQSAQVIERKTAGWTQGCECEPANRIPATILDPFGGAGTVALVAERHGRSSVTIEISPEYAEMSANRVLDESPLFADVMIDHG